MIDRFYSGDGVMIHSGKYTSYFATFLKYSDCGRFAYVNVDLSPEPVVRKLRLLKGNIGRWDYDV